MIDRIKALVEKVKDGWALAGLFGKCEKEMIIATTLHACVKNDAEHGECFSFKGDNLSIEAPHRLVENASSYAQLLTEGYLTEKPRDSQAVIVPTEKLLDYLEARLR